MRRNLQGERQKSPVTAENNGASADIRQWYNKKVGEKGLHKAAMFPVDICVVEACQAPNLRRCR